MGIGITAHDESKCEYLPLHCDYFDVTFKRLSFPFLTLMQWSMRILPGKTSNSRVGQRRSARIENTALDKHGSTLSRGGANVVVAIMRQHNLTETNDSNW